ncbi:MAG: dihydroxy-acid dehydratase [Spirochaetales bacterium]|nr:dihydroxy-acid dehydratase [Spirochaetales bacterium]
MKKGVERAPHRSLLKALGLTDTEIAQPIIGVASSASEVIPGHMHLKTIEDAVKAGIRMAGGTPMAFSTIGICDGLAMDHQGMYFSLPSRDVIADSVEVVATGTPFDGIVFISNCDKITPGMLMAMGRLNVPSLLISGGPMMAGVYDGKPIDLVSVFEAVGSYSKGEIDMKELKTIENNACPGAGSCSGLFTANSMNALSGALGVSLPGNGTIPAVDSARIRLAKETGMQVMRLVDRDLKPRDIVTADSFHNAVAVDLAMGGSTNTTLHLPAIADSFDIPFSIDLFDKLSKKVFHLCNLSPVADHHIEDLHRAGGVSALLNRVQNLGVLNEEALSVSFKSIGEIASASESSNSEVIRPIDKPYHSEGGIAVLYGNLAENGAIVKIAGVSDQIREHSGPAVVYNDGELASKEILAGKIKKGDVVVIRYEGPKGGPGMREMLSPTAALVGMGLIEDVVLITDGRFSGGSTGAVIGHLSPEAAEGGVIAVVNKGDTIKVDFNKRTLNLDIPEEEIKNRLANLEIKRKDLGNSFLGRYSHFVQSAYTGAVLRRPGNE